jgi:hypothetical protein
MGHLTCDEYITFLCEDVKNFFIKHTTKGLILKY